jgi:Na+/pantothenate symporter
MGRTGLDKYFADNFIIALLISFCCATVGLILNIVGVITCKDPKAKSNATVCLIVSILFHVIGLGAQFGGLVRLW